MSFFENGNLYRRRELHEKYGGQQQGGISTPSRFNFIMLFTSDRGKEHGYSDHWTDDGIFHYTGEGQHGDMDFVRGNLAIRDHVKNGKELYLFKYVKDKPGFVRLVGRFEYRDHHFEQRPDSDNRMRKAIVFELVSS